MLQENTICRLKTVLKIYLLININYRWENKRILEAFYIQTLQPPEVFECKDLPISGYSLVQEHLSIFPV